MGYRKIDMNTYERKAHFDYFRSLAYPYVGVTADVDVTDLRAFCGKNRLSFYVTFMHAACLAADRVPQLRQRIRDGEVIEYDECPSSHTELKDDGTYCYCTLHHHMPFAQYLKEAEKARAACRTKGIEEDEDAESMYFISTLPLVRYSALIQPAAGGDESNPRITWGMYQPDSEGRFFMPVTILLHHALADGLHIGLFYGNLNEEMERITAETL